MTITRLGATKKYADNWEEIFAGGANRSKAAVTPKTASRSAKKKKPAKKPAAKQAPTRASAKKRSSKKK